MARKSILAGDKINLEKVSILILDDNQQALELMFQVVTGFGAKTITRCDSPLEAIELLKGQTFDLLITDGQMPKVDGYTLVHWLRNQAPENNRYIPVFVVTGHTREKDVKRARDCGANFIIVKPIRPKIILDRMFWVAREERPFVQTATYCGPDRRTRRLGPPPGMKGRREEDNNYKLGTAQGPDMSQDDIDSLLKPQKVSL